MRGNRKKEPAFISDLILQALEKTRRIHAEDRARRLGQEQTIGKEVTNVADIGRIEANIDERERIRR